MIPNLFKYRNTYKYVTKGYHPTKGAAMEHFCEELIEKTYLWARKRLCSSSDAEEATQQILCEAIQAYRNAEKHGHKITAFYPWYWRIAQNQLNIFLRLKYTSAVSLDDMREILVSPDTADEEPIRADEIRAVNYAVSKLSKLHRQMIIDYYLREKSIKTIANEYGVPEGTVKRRLFDAKEDVKRSIENMENTGRSSYAPTELILIGSLAAPDYWELLNDLVVKQLLTVCRKTPHTLREISDEIAVAPVYFEDKLDRLLKDRFIKETANGKYLTDIVILPEQLWVNFSSECAKEYRGIAPKLRDILLGLEEKLRGYDFIGNDLSRGRLMWLGYIAACSKLSDLMVKSFSEKKKIPESHEKNYRYMGRFILPDERIEYPPKSSSVSWSNMHYHFRTSDYRQITYANLFESQPFADPERDKMLDQSNISLFMQIANAPNKSLTDVEEEMCAELIAEGFLEKRGGLYPMIPIISYSVLGNIEELIREAVSPLAEIYTEKIAALGDRMILPHIREDLYEEYVNYVMRAAFFPLDYVLHWAMYEDVDSGMLEIPDDYLHSSLATAVYYTK